MLLAAERRLIADFGRRMTADRLVVGTSGNLSIRSGDLLAVSPSGHAYATLTPELVGVHRLDGTAVSAAIAPTSSTRARCKRDRPGWTRWWRPTGSRSNWSRGPWRQ